MDDGWGPIASAVLRLALGEIDEGAARREVTRAAREAGIVDALRVAEALSAVEAFATSARLASQLHAARNSLGGVLGSLAYAESLLRDGSPDDRAELLCALGHASKAAGALAVALRPAEAAPASTDGTT